LEGLKGVSEHEIVHPMCMNYFQREIRKRKIKYVAKRQRATFHENPGPPFHVAKK